MKKKICQWCHKKYIPNVSTQERWEMSKYCSAKHKQLGWKNKKEHSRTCKECKKKFIAKRKQTYCSPSCRYKMGGRRERSKKVKERICELQKANFGKIKNGVVPFEDIMLTLKNYKEPLKKIPKKDGYGWYGTIALTTDGRLIQCHKCGDLKAALPGHIIGRHKMKVDDYRETYGLSPQTALVSETTRMGLRERELERIKKFTPEEKRAYRLRTIENLNKGRYMRSHYQPKESLESKNKKGTCPDQLLEKIKEVKEKLGHIPSKNEFNVAVGSQRFTHLIYKIYGSWNKAIELCHFKEKREFKKSSGFKRRYEDDELLELLQVYTRENQSIPTATDFKRDFLPSLSTYISHFKTIENARQLAGVYDILEERTKGINISKSKYLRKQASNSL